MNSSAAGISSTAAGALFRQGRPDDAVAAAGEAVRREPMDIAGRILLAELLLFTGGFERADAVLVAAEAIEPGAALVVAEFRQLLRAASARSQLLAEGRVPEFLGAPTPVQTHNLEALVALRAGDMAAAAEASGAAEAVRPVMPGIGNGVGISDFRDADDICSGSFEVLTTTGRYFWIPTDRVTRVEFHPPKRPRDLFWRRCSMTVRDGPDGDVYMPVLYETTATMADSLRLGRSTDWSGTTPVRGIGQRVFLAGEEGIPANELRTLEFSA